MPMKYNVIEIFTSEEARYHGRPLHEAIIQYIRGLKLAARCIATRGVAGCYENGEVASRNIEILSFNMPLKIEVILPASELAVVLPTIEEMVADGIVVVEDMEIRCHKTKKSLIPRQIRVKDVMTQSPKAVSPNTTISEVVRLLLSSDFNSVPVVDSANSPIGIITQSDLINRAGMPIRLGLLEEFEQNKIDALLESLKHKTAEKTMTRPVTVIAEDKPLTEAVDLMLKDKLKRLPVVDVAGKLVGMLSRLDILKTISHETPDWKAIQQQNVIVEGARFVRDIMRRDTHTGLPDTTIDDVIKIIDSNDIQRVAVVDPGGKLLGLISDRDVLVAFSNHQASIWDYLVSKIPFFEIGHRHREFIAKMKMSKAADVMKTNPMTVQEETSIDDAIRIMTQKGLKRLPVVDKSGRFTGMISRDSLLRAGWAPIASSP